MSMTIALPNVQLEHDVVQVNGIRMHYVTAGQGPLMLMLHGFPEFWYSWRHQIAAFSEHFTVVAPDQRGYNETEKPARGYDVGTLATDITELITALGHERAILVGHDWGGMVAWTVAITAPERVERLVCLNAPHPAVLMQVLRTNPLQILRSLYVGFFQLPGLPEALISAGNYALLEQGLRGTAAVKDAFSDADIQYYKAAISQPGALTAALNWYRAAPQAPNYFANKAMHVAAPTLLLWGTSDPVLGPELICGTEAYVNNLTVRHITPSSHWVQQEQPEQVNAALYQFLDDLIR